jgi:hypothetical protein
LKGKCHAQPSQDNRDNLVKKLEKGTTAACTKPLQKNTKLSKKGMSKIHGKKINAHTICSNNVPMCFNKERSKRSDRRCYGCKEKGHKIGSCLSTFRPPGGGVPGPTSELSPRVPTQMGRHETEHEGGRNRQRGNPRPSRCPAPRSGALAVGGYKRPLGERALCAGPLPRATNLFIREPWTFLL